MTFSLPPVTRAIVLSLLASFSRTTSAAPFELPTANRAIFERGNEEKFFVPTTGKTWTSGTFGCVRSDGRQFHEGLDIRCLQRNKRGEPADPVMASCEGTVAYVNRKPSLSNYGNYIILRHQVDGLEIYTTYAHLSEIRTDLKPGTTVKASESIGIMGRTANTQEGISKERAHVHFEINVFVNEGFPAWYKKYFPDQRNDHGQWNGQNLLGLDPLQILLEQKHLGSKFNLVQHIQQQPMLCRVFVRNTDFPWLKRYAPLIRANPAAQKDGVAGYELALNFNGMPVQMTPKSAAEVSSKSKFQLLSVNEAEQREHPCRKLVIKRNGRWELTAQGQNLLQLLTY
jgi:peptidoglycan LD-endopeptidase LytH